MLNFGDKMKYKMKYRIKSTIPGQYDDNLFATKLNAVRFARQALRWTHFIVEEVETSKTVVTWTDEHGLSFNEE